MEILIAITSAVLVFCIIYLASYHFFSRITRVKNRITSLSNKEYESVIQYNEKYKNKIKGRNLGFGKRISSDLETAGILLHPDEYLLTWTGTTIIPSLLFLIAGGNLISVVAVLIIGFIIPPLLVARSKRLRMRKFEKQLLDSIILIGNSLKAGFTFYQAMESISKEMPEPIAGEFSKMLWEIKLGESTDEAMERMATRTKSEDLGLLVSAILIQRKAGGNLADVLDNISDTIKDRLRIKGEVRVHTASGRISGIIIGLLPAFLTGVLMIINPAYIIEFFSNPLGIGMIIIALIMEFLGFLVIKRIVDIKM